MQKFLLNLYLILEKEDIFKTNTEQETKSKKEEKKNCNYTKI